MLFSYLFVCPSFLRFVFLMNIVISTNRNKINIVLFLPSYWSIKLFNINNTFSSRIFLFSWWTTLFRPIGNYKFWFSLPIGQWNCKVTIWRGGVFLTGSTPTYAWPFHPFERGPKHHFACYVLTEQVNFFVQGTFLEIWEVKSQQKIDFLTIEMLHTRTCAWQLRK